MLASVLTLIIVFTALFGLIVMVRRLTEPREDVRDSLIMAALSTSGVLGVCGFFIFVMWVLAWVWRVTL